MPDSDNALREELLETDSEFRRLYREHQEYERRLNDLYQKSSLSQEDEMEQKRIKLHKLRLKDQMEQILRSHRDTRVSA